MATSVPSLPSTSATTESQSTTSDLLTQLDILLESYLDLLDTYTNLRAQLSQDFSSGFFSLAQANRNSTLGAGRRYGEERYDERMKAGRRVQIQQRREARRSTSDGSKNQERQQKGHGTTAEDTQVSSSSSDKHNNVNDAEGYDFTIAQIHSTPASRTPSDSSSPAELPAQLSLPRDPLTWFGILTPPPLRTTQGTFISSLTGTIPALLTTICRMQALESQIWEMRRKLGIETEDGHDVDTKCTSQLAAGDGDGDGIVEKEEDDETQPKLQSETDKSSAETGTDSVRTTTSSSSSSPRRQINLVSRSSEPRSRVLKLD